MTARCRLRPNNEIFVLGIGADARHRMEWRAVLEGYVSACVYGRTLGQIFDAWAGNTTRLSDPLLAFCCHSALPWTTSANGVDVLDVVQAAGSAFAQRHAALRNLLFSHFLFNTTIECHSKRIRDNLVGPVFKRRPLAVPRPLRVGTCGMMKDGLWLTWDRRLEIPAASHHHHPGILSHRRMRGVSLATHRLGARRVDPTTFHGRSSEKDKPMHSPGIHINELGVGYEPARRTFDVETTTFRPTARPLHKLVAYPRRRVVMTRILRSGSLGLTPCRVVEVEGCCGRRDESGGARTESRTTTTTSHALTLWYAGKCSGEAAPSHPSPSLVALAPLVVTTGLALGDGVHRS
ncbi:hypothetical protein D9611_009754 [Ephemerocybe angulata]|uniref:Uncharacterized protein n=1 Tax=Ephemerocybe angulata TaxID=980116 RepID=A0A8H5CFA4_9AGAR|nr:hypothetical protein D9611_009754 [Tulosesus angulatus]